MSSKRNALQTLVRSGASGVELVRSDPKGPVGKYMASVKINGQDLCGYNCCVLCKQLFQRGKYIPRNTWKHKTRHLAGGAKYSDKELEAITRNFNNHSTQSKQEVIPHQIQSYPNNGPLLQLNFPTIQPSQDKDIEMTNEPLSPYVSPVIKFSHPTTIMIAGPTFSGKTTFVRRMLHEEMIDPSPQRIIWVYK